MNKIGLILSLLLIFLVSCRPDLCKEINCQNGGECKEGVCECPPAFSGAKCDFLIASKFLGIYRAQYDCSSATQTVAVELKPGENNGTVTLRNLGDYSCSSGDYLIEATTSGDSLYLKSQSVCAAKAYVFEGYGKWKQDTLRLYFTVTYDALPGIANDVCNAVFVKSN